MELFKDCMNVMKGKSRASNALRDVWTLRILVQQYVIGINKKYEDENKRYKEGNTILHKICEKGDVVMLEEYLYLPGIDINMKNNATYTALMIASELGHVKCVEILCK